MCRAKTDVGGGRRCKGHLEKRIKELKVKEEEKEERLALLRSLKSLADSSMARGKPYTHALRKFAHNWDMPERELPASYSKLKRDIANAEKALVNAERARELHQNALPITIHEMVAAERSGNFAHAVESSEPVASDSMTIRDREVSMTDEKAGTEALAQVVNDALNSGDYDEQGGTDGPRVRMVTLFSSANGRR